MRAFISCEESGAMRRAFTERGHFAVSCDLLSSRDGRDASASWLAGVEMGAGKAGNVHVVGDCFTWLEWFRERGVYFDLMIAHPPCTYLLRAGYHWCNRPDSAPGVMPLKGAPRRAAMVEAADFFHRLLNYPHVPRVAVENPRPIVHAGLPEATQYIQPWMFGDFEVKATGLWLRNLPPLAPVYPTLSAYRDAAGLPADAEPEAKVWKMPPGPERSKLRSTTFPGIAAACADQWGRLV